MISADRPLLPRISSGNVQLDAILGGGFPANSINMIMGEPGSGKTILAERLIFANAARVDDRRPILYLSTLSEPLEKLVRYLQQFSFFDDNVLLSGAIRYDSIAAELEKNGVAALAAKLQAIITEVAPKIIVIDSFKAIHDLSTSVAEMRRMLYEVSGLLTAYDTTAFFLGEYSEGQIATFPEFAVADGMIELARKKHGTRDERYLRVLKLRGSNYQEGLHAFRITGDGLDVFPRLTSPIVPLAYTANEDRLSTGVPSLDKFLEGGVWAGGATLLEGPTGSGKTTLALQFVLDGVRRGEPGLYVNFQENPTQLERSVRSLGGDIPDAQRNGLHYLYASPVELQIDSILVELFRTIQERDIKRVVIDSVGDLVGAASDLTRLYSYLYALMQHFVARRVACVLTQTTTATASPMEGQISAMSDAILRLDLTWVENRARRTLKIMKARGSNHELDVQDFRITGTGIEILPEVISPARQVRALTEVSRALTAAASFDEVLQLVVARAAEMLAAPASVLMLADDDGELSVRAAVGLAAAAQGVRHPLGETLIDELQQGLGVGPERFLGVPLVVSGSVTGLLAVGLADGPPGDHEEWLLSALADQASVAIEKTRLDERGRLRDRLIGIVSHDLRNPINTIQLGASLLLDNRALDPHAKRTIARIMSAAERAGRMIADLLDYTQASLGGGIHIDRVPSSLGAIVRGVVDELAAADRCFEVVESGDTAASLDGDRIAQVVGNLLSNALSYQTPATPIWIAIGGDDGAVTVAVRNLGPVIPSDRMHDIFRPMQQLTAGTGRGQRSVGLGLYIVEAIVAAHAGTIAVTSTAAEGTTFSVRLPRT